jgi:hypothetical protein
LEISVQNGLSLQRGATFQPIAGFWKLSFYAHVPTAAPGFSNTP